MAWGSHIIVSLKGITIGVRSMNLDGFFIFLFSLTHIGVVGDLETPAN